MLGFGALGQFALGQPGENATANGAVLTATISLIAGVATGDAIANGDLLSVTASAISGVATGDAATQGAEVTATASIIPGTASAGTVVPIVSAAPMPRVIRRRDGEAVGDVVVAFARLLPGRAATISLLPGQVSGTAVAGDILPLRANVELFPGVAAGELNLHDDELVLLLEAA